MEMAVKASPRSYSTTGGGAARPGAREELSFPRQRENYGSEARLLLDREMSEAGIEASQLPGYDTWATGHLQVAAVIAAGPADAGIASEPAARAYGLAFIPLAAEHFDLVIPAGQFASREVQGLLRILSSAWLVDQLANLPGYDPARCGERIATLPQRHGR